VAAARDQMKEGEVQVYGALAHTLALAGRKDTARAGTGDVIGFARAAGLGLSRVASFASAANECKDT
jgi:hypothetical protein